MDKHEVDGYVGQVGVLTTAPMLSRVWRCGKCEHDHSFDTPVGPPAPCNKCGCRAFRKITPLPH